MPGEAPTASTLAGRLRPLSGLEEELVHADREGNAVALCNELLARCLARPGRDPGRARAEVDALLVSERDLALVTTCSTCDAGIEAPVYLAEVILAELRERGRQLLREVHLLARTYHWSERQILSLSVARRRAYLTLIEADHDAALVLAGAGDA